MKKYILFFSLLFSSIHLWAQTVYAITNERKIYRINDDYSTTFMSTVTGSSYAIGDIAIDPSGVMYGIAYNMIYRIDPVTGIATYLNTVPNPGGCPALICSNDYKLYTLSTGSDYILYAYDIATNTFETVANIGFSTSGDLTFYKGNLIFQTWSPNSIYMVKAFNPETGVLRDLLCFPQVFQLWGLTSKFDECGNSAIFGSNPYQPLLTIDFDTQVTTQLPTVFPTNQNFYGLASTNEHLGSVCPPQNLPDLNCALSTESFSSGQPAIYPNPVNDILHFKNISGAKSIRIYSSDAKLIRTFVNPSESIDVSGLSQGVYLIEIQSEEQTVTKKFSKS
jgi:hypothetical protein